MHDADHLNRLYLPGVGDDVLVEIPEAVLPAEQLLVVMPDSWTALKLSQLGVELCANPLRRFGVVLGDRSWLLE